MKMSSSSFKPSSGAFYDKLWAATSLVQIRLTTTFLVDVCTRPPAIRHKYHSARGGKKDSLHTIHDNNN